MTLVFAFVLAILVLALVLALLRLARGPSLPDRVVALDLISMIIAAKICVYVLWVNQPVLLDAVTVMAVITFFGTVAVARYLERRSADHD
jgi:multicomponent Na+:H+ antiporter subunit F